VNTPLLLRRAALLMVVSGLLCGCSLPRMIDSDVQSFVGTTPLVSGASYRFERLPSQGSSRLQDQIETLADTALEHHGLRRMETSARYLVQLEVGAEGVRNPYYRPSHSRLVLGSNGVWYEQPVFPDMETPWYRHRVHLLLRDSGNGQVAYETSATFDGPWSDTLNLLPPMLEAALKDYPNPGARKVVVELPSADKEAP
jgi:hypothetical protein